MDKQLHLSNTYQQAQDALHKLPDEQRQEAVALLQRLQVGLTALQVVGTWKKKLNRKAA